MLVLSRKPGERIVIGDDIVITVVKIDGGHARLGIQCPGHTPVHREEVYRRIRAEHYIEALNELPEQFGEYVDLGYGPPTSKGESVNERLQSN